MTLAEAQSYIMPFGKYKSKYLFDIMQDNYKYIEWVYKISTNNNLTNACAILLGYLQPQYDIPDSKIEMIVKECIMHRGYSESEANIFLRKLKTIES